MKIGILALQGAVEPHERALESLGISPVQIRTAEDLTDICAIILPGGESTAMLKLLEMNRLREPLQNFCASNPCWGVCAGAILLAARVTSPTQPSFGCIDIDIERNGYGRQRDSFIATLLPAADTGWKAVEGVFIRAPRIRRLGAEAKPILFHGEEPVMVEYKNCLVSTFHPELSKELTVHQYFIEKASTWMTATPNS